MNKVIVFRVGEAMRYGFIDEMYTTRYIEWCGSEFNPETEAVIDFRDDFVGVVTESKAQEWGAKHYINTTR